MTYVLWLDESGEFRDYGLPKASLIGGILIRNDIIKNIKNADYPIRIHAHANSKHWSVAYLPDKIQEMLEHLSALKSRGTDEDDIRWVVAQNTKQEGADSSKLLYLRLLVGCVYKVYIRLCQNAGIEPTDEKNAPELIVYAASRTDYDIQNNPYQITLDDYLKYRNQQRQVLATSENYRAYCDLLDKKITWVDNEQELDANPDHPNANPKLWFADYVCNFWYNREVWLKPYIYTKGEYKKVKSCYEDLVTNRFEFPLTEEDNIYEIKQLCDEKNLAEAILNYCSLLFTSNLLLDNDKIIIKNYIHTAFEKNCYRDNKKSIKTLSQQCEEIEGKTNNYAACYQKLQKISELIEDLQKNINIDAPFTLIQFKLDILRADCQLRLGHFPSAESFMKSCENNLQNNRKAYPPEMNFQFYEKQGLANIDYFKFDEAIKNMEAAEKIFIKDNKKDQDYGEYYGDALCMHLLALMPKLRVVNSKDEKNTILKDCRKYSDIAMHQYISYESELERHRQYRSFIELETNSPDSVRCALKWLIKAKCGKKNTQYYYDKGYHYSKKIQLLFEALLKNESADTIRWYLLYYVLIMSTAKSNGNTIGDIMFQELFKNNKIYNLLGVNSISNDGSVFNLYSPNNVKNPPEMHPMPTIYWKIAQYLQIRYFEEIKAQTNKNNISNAEMKSNQSRIETINLLYDMAINYFKETIPIRKIAIEASKWAFMALVDNNIQEADNYIKEAKTTLKNLIYAKALIYKNTDLPVIMLKTLKDNSLNSIEKLNKLAYLVAY